MSDTPLSELMHRDPLSLSDQNLDVIIGALRKSRVNFVNGDAKAGSMKPKSAAAKKREELSKELDKVNLYDLGL